MKIKSRLISVISFVLIVIAIVYYLHLLKIGVVQHTFKAVQQIGPWGVLIGIIVQTFVNVVPVPGEFTTFLLMEIYGPFLGGFYSWIGGVLGAIGAYYLIRWLSKPFAGAIKDIPYKNKLERFVSEQKASGLLTVRFVPLLPYHMINYASGLLKIDIKTFIWTTMIGLMPYHIAVSGMFAGVRRGSLAMGAIGAAAFIGLILFGRTLKKRKVMSINEK
ncbi:TVP38/TMEM64 family protein [Gorillibacterium massiliense]|uniref:TVP38/TMEM64 family protein n=1 Tax=Gorillibacterium massiliense TaxID=1280390 RepID=UPI000593E955|nr:VTT domain-containing protein [Gorillibacterium massiliense]